MRDKYLWMEEQDNRQISREIQGETVDEFVYRVDDGLRLSYAGVRYAAGLYGGIQVNKVECSYNTALDQFEATVYAENKRSGIILPGSAEHPASKNVDGEQVRDMFARRTAVSKASRNALLAVMPVEHIKAVIVQLQDSSNSQDSEVIAPVVVDVESIKAYLSELGIPEALEYSVDPSRNVVKVRPTRFLGSISWCKIDNALEKLNGSWCKKCNRWKVPF